MALAQIPCEFNDICEEINKDLEKMCWIKEDVVDCKVMIRLIDKK